MSKIIKGGEIRFYSLNVEDLSKEEDKETFSPLYHLLPEEARQKTKNEPKTEEDTSSDENILPEASPSPESMGQAVDSLPEVKSPKNDPPSSTEAQTDTAPDIDPLSLPGVAEKLALLEQEAYEKGFAQGQKDGLELGRQQYESVAKRLKRLLENLENEIEHHVLSLERPVFELVKAIAEKVIHREISQGPEVLIACIREALAHVVEQSRVKLHLNPEDIEYMEAVMQELSVEFSKLKDFDLVPDDNVSRGGCLLETDFGLIDATYERKWREILSRLEG